MVTTRCSSQGAMEPDKEPKKKLNDDMVLFMVKRGDPEAPRATARMSSYVDLQRKRRRAEAARGRIEELNRGKKAPGKKEIEGELRDKSGDNAEHRRDDQRTGRRQDERGEKGSPGRLGSRSRSRSAEPVDRCGGRRRRRRRRRRRSCRRRRRRCRRRRSRRRRRRSCSRRRRRRSCGRRRRRARRRCRGGCL